MCVEKFYFKREISTQGKEVAVNQTTFVQGFVKHDEMVQILASKIANEVIDVTVYIKAVKYVRLY
jgi:hypothetical protein